MKTSEMVLLECMLGLPSIVVLVVLEAYRLESNQQVCNLMEYLIESARSIYHADENGNGDSHFHAEA